MPYSAVGMSETGGPVGSNQKDLGFSIIGPPGLDPANFSRQDLSRSLKSHIRLRFLIRNDFKSLFFISQLGICSSNVPEHPT